MKYFLLLNIFLVHFSYGQNCQNDSLFNQFKKDIQIELARHNCLKWDDETRTSFYSLIINCPVEDIVKHADDSIPAVRCNIFVALAVKNADKKLLSEISSKHKKDTASYINCLTDVSINRTVNDEMQTILKSKAKLSDLSSYKSRLETIKNRDRIIIPGEYHGLISKDELLKIDSITYSLKRCKVVSFLFGNNTVSIATNNIFTDEIKELIKKTEPREFLFIEKIKVEYPDKSTRFVGPKLLEIR